MDVSLTFLKAILDSITDQISVIDRHGNIVFINQSWIDFSTTNKHPPINWQTVNYLTICDQSAQKGDTFATQAAKGIRKVIHGKSENFYLEYPCHSPTQKRWFMMRVTPLASGERSYFVISHHDITKRKIAEETVLDLSKLDGLTKLPNYRNFSQFLTQEWKRCTRLQAPITLAMIDIDYFKCINDTYGHLKGDEYLFKIAQHLKRMVRRPSDLCARYGGEEFALILSNTPLEPSIAMIEKFLTKIRTLAMPNPHSPVMPIITLSVGLVTLYPQPKTSEKELIQKADELLYKAKNSGRNQLVYHQESQK